MIQRNPLNVFLKQIWDYNQWRQSLPEKLTTSYSFIQTINSQIQNSKYFCATLSCNNILVAFAQHVTRFKPKRITSCSIYQFMIGSCPSNCIGSNEFTNLIYVSTREGVEQNWCKYFEILGKITVFMLKNFFSFFKTKKRQHVFLTCW